MTLFSLATVALTCTVPAALEKVDPVPEWGKSINGVRARIFSVKEEYQPGEDLQFVLMFQNISSKTLPWPGCNLSPYVLPKGVKRPETLDRINLRFDLDHEVARTNQLALERIQKLERLDRLAPNDIRIVVITINQPGDREDEKLREAVVGAPQRERAELLVRLEPGKYRFRATYTPMGFPMPDRLEKIEREDPDEMAKLWKGQSIPIPPVYVRIQKSSE